jgi:muramoyltetrapeptide carboxypeptidase
MTQPDMAIRGYARRVATKPKALLPGAHLGIFTPASPGSELRTDAGIRELRRLGYVAEKPRARDAEGFFAGDASTRAEEFLGLARNDGIDGLIALRGGYGSNYLLPELQDLNGSTSKCIVGFSDLTTLQSFLWQKFGWVTLYGPMVAAGFDAGADVHDGYESESFRLAVTTTAGGWSIPLQGETLLRGRDAAKPEGVLLGGCMTLLEATIGTPWELDTRDAILVLEDRSMKPYQVDRVLMHLKQAGKFDSVRGFVLGEFPESDARVSGSPTVRDICARVLGSMGVPIVFGSPIGHTPRPMLTIPLGVNARLVSEGEGLLEILEPAVRA